MYKVPWQMVTQTYSSIIECVFNQWFDMVQNELSSCLF